MMCSVGFYPDTPPLTLRWSHSHNSLEQGLSQAHLCFGSSMLIGYIFLTGPSIRPCLSLMLGGLARCCHLKYSQRLLGA